MGISTIDFFNYVSENSPTRDFERAYTTLGFGDEPLSAMPEPRTHRRGSPAWTPREVATPGRGLRCRQLRTLEALAGGQRTVFIWRSLAIGLPGRGS